MGHDAAVRWFDPKCNVRRQEDKQTESGLTLQQLTEIRSNEKCFLYFKIADWICMNGGDIVRRGQPNLSVVGKLALKLKLALSNYCMLMVVRAVSWLHIGEVGVISVVTNYIMSSRGCKIMYKK